MMDVMSNDELDQLLMKAPGGMAKIALDDMLTILYATDTFLSMMKNVADKLTTAAALRRIIYSADIIYVTQQLAAQKNRKDNKISLNFRVLQQDGTFKWIMMSGEKLEEVYPAQPKPVPVYAFVSMDATEHMLKYKRMEQSADYQRIISELSREISFEYEIASDTLHFSPVFREIFGREADITGFRKKLEKTKIIHPEELPAVNKIFNSVMGGRKQVRFDMRLMPKEGGPVLYLCYASIIFDENKNPFKVVGKLSVTKHREEEEEETIIPQYDTLTNVCTKESAEGIIKQTINRQGVSAFSALMVVDVRNYKGINEIAGALHGENVLKTIAGQIKEQFRSTDVIARYGTGEFVIFVKDIQSDKFIYERAEHLCKGIDRLYSFEHNKNSLSISIGIAFQKGQLPNYTGLLANANTALIMAKKSSNSSFEVFYGGMN